MFLNETIVCVPSWKRNHEKQQYNTRSVGQLRRFLLILMRNAVDGSCLDLCPSLCQDQEYEASFEVNATLGTCTCLSCGRAGEVHEECSSPPPYTIRTVPMNDWRQEYRIWRLRNGTSTDDWLYVALHETAMYGTEFYHVDPDMGVTDQMAWDINPGPGDSNPSRVTALSERFLVFYATPCDGCHRQVMLLDSTSHEMGIVGQDLFPRRSPTEFFTLAHTENAVVYAKSSSGIHAYHLANATTVTVADPPGFLYHHYWSSAGSRWLLTSTTFATGVELFQTASGAATTTSGSQSEMPSVLLADLNPGRANAFPQNFIDFDGCTYFWARRDASLQVYLHRIDWSDAESSSNALVAVVPDAPVISPQSTDTNGAVTSSAVADMLVHHNCLYIPTPTGLYRLDHSSRNGTFAMERMVWPSNDDFSKDEIQGIRDLTVFQDAIYFEVALSGNRYALGRWKDFGAGGNREGEIVTPLFRGYFRIQFEWNHRLLFSTRDAEMEFDGHCWRNLGTGIGSLRVNDRIAWILPAYGRLAELSILQAAA